MKTIQDHLDSATVVQAGRGFSFRQTLPLIRFADGTSLSVQAGCGHYCSPRNDEGPWTLVEVDYLSVAPESELWTSYAEDPEDLTKTVFAYVPIEMVMFYIGAHGGMLE